MKRLYASIMLFAIAGVLLTSCSNTSKLSFNKRHYKSGYFVDFGNKGHTNPVASAVKLSPIAGMRQIAPPAISKPETSVAKNYSIAESAMVEKTVTTKKIKENNLFNTNIIASSPTPLLLNTWVVNDISSSTGDGHRDQNNVSVPYVVIVLCAIFIPPLGVGLMYGINSYFWIDLILTLLFFFPGMIFALIVVLM